MTCKYKSRVWDNGWCNVVCMYCTFRQERNCKYNKETNDDRVRGMNDNELATFINRIVICHHLRNEGHCEKCPIHPAKPCDTEGIAEWIKQPAE